MEIEKKEREKQFRIFCDMHRPLRIMKEIEERDKQTLDEIFRYCKIIEKCIEIDKRTSHRQRKLEKESLKF